MDTRKTTNRLHVCGRQAFAATLALLLGLGCIPIASAQTDAWTSIGPAGGRVRSIAIDPQTPPTMYLGADGGVFKSIDRGSSWRRIGLADWIVDVLVIHPLTPDVLYATDTINAGGVFKSTDGGNSWSVMNSGLRSPTGISDLVVDPLTPTTLYAVGTAGAFKSTDGAATWSFLGSGLPQFPQVLAIDPAAPTRVYVGTREGLFLSTNGGASWNATTLTNVWVHSVAIDPHTPTTVHVGTRTDGVFTSTNGGASWTFSGLAGAPDVYALAVDPHTPTTIYAATLGAGVFRTTDGGGSWNAFNYRLIDRFVFAVKVDPHDPSRVYAGTDFRGILERTAVSDGWQEINTGFDALLTSLPAPDPQQPDTIFVGAGGSNGGAVFRTTDGGASWNPVGPVNTSIGGLTVDPQVPSTLYSYAGAQFFPAETGLYKSTDGGDSWRLLTTEVGAVAIDPHASSTIYGREIRIRNVTPDASGTSGVAKSTDGGETWIVTDIAADEIATKVMVSPAAPTILYATSRDLRLRSFSVWKSTNAGDGWVRVLSGGVGFGLLALDPTDPDIVYVGGGGSQVLKSTDGGATWNPITGLSNISISALAIDPLSPATLYAGTVGSAQTGGVFTSTNGGASWMPLNAGLTDRDVWGVAVDARGAVLAATGSGVFVLRRGGSGAAVQVSPVTVPRAGVVTASWSGIADPTPNDWLGLYASGSSDQDFVTWLYVGCTKRATAEAESGSCPLTIPATVSAGTYEVRLFANGGSGVYTRLATSGPITVTTSAGPTVTASPTTVTVGGTVTVEWSGITNPTPNDWLGLYAPGTGDDAFLTWAYVSCSKAPGAVAPSGSCSLVLPVAVPPGPYEVRLFSNGGAGVYTPMATSNLVFVQ